MSSRFPQPASSRPTSSCSSRIFRVVQQAQARAFNIAPHHDIHKTAFDLHDLVMNSRDVSRSLTHAIGLLYESATNYIDHSLPIALVAEEFYLQTQPRENARSEAFVEGMEKVAVDMFVRAWLGMTDLGLHRARVEDVPSDPTIDQLFGASAFLADLYAVRIVSTNRLCDVIDFAVARFTEVEHLLCLFVIFSRANTYKGEKLPNVFYLEVIVNIRQRCRMVIGNHSTKAENDLISFIRNLLRHSCKGLDSGRVLYCEIAHHHVVTPSFRCADMLRIDGSNDLEILLHLYAHPAPRPPSIPSISHLEARFADFRLNGEPSYPAAPHRHTGTPYDISTEYCDYPSVHPPSPSVDLESGRYDRIIGADDDDHEVDDYFVGKTPTSAVCIPILQPIPTRAYMFRTILNF